MEQSLIREKAERIRDVIRYIHRFKNATVVIYIDGIFVDSPVFLSHIKDICLIHESGLRVILVPGARERIDEILKNANIDWTYHNGYRITSENAMPLIKMAAFDVSNQIMTALAGEKKTAVIGNWVRVRGKGVIDGFDYATIGEIDKLQEDSLKTVLDNGFIPIFPCIGWSVSGKPYNISSIQLAAQIAVHLKADKLFFLLPNANINPSLFNIPEGIGLSPEGNVPALNLEELDAFLQVNKDKKNIFEDKIQSVLLLAKDACKAGVTRVHILNGDAEGSLPCEIFSDLGSGTMIYANNYGRIRDMRRNDIADVLSVMKPFVEQGILLPRTKKMLNEQFPFFIVYELDGAIRACASLIPYRDGQMEIAGVAVDKTCSHIGVGPKLIDFLIKRATQMHATGLFLLTTQTSDWFEHLGFISTDISTLPEKRRKEWTPKRNSKVLRYPI